MEYTRKQLLEAIRYWTNQLRMLEECGDGGGGFGGDAGGPGGFDGGFDGGGFAPPPSGGGHMPTPPMMPPPRAYMPFGYGMPYAARGFGVYGMNPYARLGTTYNRVSGKKKKKPKKRKSK